MSEQIDEQATVFLLLFTPFYFLLLRETLKIINMKISNTQDCFVQLWLRLERTRRLLRGQYRRYCIRNILKAWFGFKATDDFIWNVCNMCEQAGWDELPPPSLHPRKHRELLRAIVSVTLGISCRKIRIRQLDAAYSIAFPRSTPLNVNKKKHPHPSL